MEKTHATIRASHVSFTTEHDERTRALFLLRALYTGAIDTINRLSGEGFDCYEVSTYLTRYTTVRSAVSPSPELAALEVVIELAAKTMSTSKKVRSARYILTEFGLDRPKVNR
jgi:hypothetical protein